jgi:hypothetical protein
MYAYAFVTLEIMLDLLGRTQEAGGSNNAWTLFDSGQSVLEREGQVG